MYQPSLYLAGTKAPEIVHIRVEERQQLPDAVVVALIETQRSMAALPDESRPARRQLEGPIEEQASEAA